MRLLAARWWLIFAWAFLPPLSMASSSAVVLSPLSPPPDWASLEPYQQTITRSEFEHLIREIYNPDGTFFTYMSVSDSAARIYSDPAHTNLAFTLHFASSERAAKPVPVTYRTRAICSDKIRPLQGLKIALDPGHIGGDWAKLEERYFKLGDDPPVEEAQLNELTCSILADLLQADGADIVWIKKGFHPTTSERPDGLEGEARRWLGLLHTAVNPARLTYRANMLFYRIAEIRARAEIQHDLKPDLTICVHYNADDWGNPDHPTLTARSRLIIFANGSYDGSELRFDDQKAELLRKLLDRTAAPEIRGCELVGNQLLQRLHYEPEPMFAGCHRIGSCPSLFTRNLIANRLYHGPVIYCEGPYMNARDAYYRIIAGDYLGTRTIGGQSVPSIYREYAKGIEEGVRQYFGVN